jgi:hypothetical protein
MNRKCLILIAFICMLFLACQVPRTPRLVSSYSKPDVRNYTRIAVFPMVLKCKYSNETLNFSDLLIASIYNIAPNIDIVERAQLSRVIREQDLLPNRLDPTTRAKLRKILGVQAILVKTYEDTCCEYRLQISEVHLKLMDTETGVIKAQINIKSGSKGAAPHAVADLAASALFGQAN